MQTASNTDRDMASFRRAERVRHHATSRLTTLEAEPEAP